MVWDPNLFAAKDYTTFECDLTHFIVGIVERGGVFPGYGGANDRKWLAEQQPFTPNPEPPPN